MAGPTVRPRTATPRTPTTWSAGISPSDNNNPIDQYGHGTFTAGEIGAVGNNGIGVAGTDWNVQLMPVQFLDSSGNGTDVAAAEAIDYAVDHGAKVVNASWGSSGTDPTIAAAIEYADQHGVIIVAAAGNNGTDDDNSSTWFSPASYSVNYPNLITVAATDSNGDLASFSNYGVASVQLAAPGVNIEGIELNGTDGTDSGTSMAAPLVTGTIALVEAAHPSWSMSQVIDAVLDTTTPDPNLVGKVTTGGIVNAAAAVANTDGPYVVSASPDGSVNSSSGFSSVSLNFNEEINPATFTPAQVTVTGPQGTISGVAVTPVSGSNDHEFTISFPTQFAAGTYTLSVGPDVQDWYGNDMNQNRDSVNGQSSDAFVDSITCSTDLLSVTGISNPVTAGTSGTFTVTAMSPSGGTDTSFLGTIEFSSTDSQAGLPASYTFTGADAGTHTFTVTFKTAGSQAITATDTANGSIIGSRVSDRRSGRGGEDADGHRLPRERYGGRWRQRCRHRLRCIWQRGDRLYRHGVTVQQRPPHAPAVKLHFHGRRRGPAQLHHRARYGRDADDHGDRHRDAGPHRHRVGNHRSGCRCQQLDGHGFPGVRHGGRDRTT